MTTVELYTKGARVWLPHAQKVWEGAELLENYTPSQTALKVKTEESNEVKTLTIKSESDLPHLRNPAILIGENDLTSLSYLHEPAVLYNLQVRFCQNKFIYTYCGIVLVAINPYDDLPIYDCDTIQTYRGQTTGDMEPHIFAVAEEAYTKLEREQRDQSIIVSGESGAGKTVSAKYAMRYFATVGGSSTETQIEKKVLASSPIMEAIGNAKTTRNDNSSRFGKFIELQFNKHYHIIGASMRTYLLEKSRVVFQAPDERNYHIFYQLCAARAKLPHLKLREQNYFHYLNQGKNPNIDGISDLEEYEETVNALTLLGFSEKEQMEMFKVLAAVLHLGNVDIVEALISSENEHDQEGCGIRDTDEALISMTELLEINKDQMNQWLCTKRIVSMREEILKPMSVYQAKMSRDALAKHIYAELFNWIVTVINKALETDMPRHKFIGVLDIYGFETFEINSFEQFCINYANEKLQQQFNMHVFKLEQEEYIKEGIQWNMIDFYDNQPCIDLIESKLGVLSLLDEECRMPKGTDGTWTEKLYLKCKQYKHFAKARFGTTAFVITHFADKVQYESSGFLEKNRDTVIEEQMSVLKYSKNNFVRRLFCEEKQSIAVTSSKLKVVSAKPNINTQKTHKKTVGSQFRDSLNLLMTTLNATTPHYVRCIKPNDYKAAFDYNPQRAIQQLRACGVLETIRISAAGFPSRWSYFDFFCRYRVLCKFKDIKRNDMKQTCQNILKQYVKTPDMFMFGKTKILFRAGQVAYLEKLRADKLKKCCIIMQSTVRAFICRKKYLRIKRAVENIQRYSRGYLARRLADTIRRDRAATTLQCYIRGWIKKVQYRRLKKVVLGLQSYSRGYLARREFMAMKYNAKAVVIQKYIRGYLARKHYRKRIHKIIICQSAVRRFLARRQYKKLKIEARSIDHVKKLNKGLENKIISLQQKIGEINKHNHELKTYQNEATELRRKLTTFRALEIEIKNMNNLLIAKNKTIEKLEEELKIEKDEKMDLLEEQEKFKQETEMRQELTDQEMCKLRKEIDNINEIAAVHQKKEEEVLKVRIEQEKNLIINEYDDDRQAYQKLLQEYNSLEQHCEELEKQINNQSRMHSHLRSNSDISSIVVDESLLSTTDIPEDHGYGSVRSTASLRSTGKGKLENFDCNNEDTLLITSHNDASNNIADGKPDKLEKVDVGLVLQLQHKLTDSEREKERLRKRLDEIELSPKSEKAENAAHDTIRIAQLELANSKLKTQLFEITDSIEEGNGKDQLTIHLKTLQEELERRAEEIIQLKGVLASQTDNMKTIVSCRSKTGEYINEDGELALAYETQKTINKQLELELQDEKAKYKVYEKEFRLEIEKLKEDNERQQRLLSANLSTTPQSQTEAYMQHEITRLTTENLNLQDKNDNLNELVHKLKKQVKLLTKKLRESGLDFDDTADEKRIENVASRNRLPSLKKKGKEYLGMFSYKSEEENMIMKLLVTELKPRTAVALLPGLPAYIIFMCIRHTDFINDEYKVRSLLSSYSNAVRKVIKKRHEDFETNVLWLSNTIRLLHTMKQYSGDRATQVKNTPRQNEQCLRNFDLSEYRQVLTEMALWINRGVIRNVSEKIQPLIVPAILEHEEIAGIGGNKMSGFRSRTSSVRELESPGVKQKPTDLLLQELTSHYKILTFYGVDPEVISQIFKQIFYFLCASSLNNLLLRKELCHWSKGLQIRHNLSHFEMWTREKHLDEQAIQATLQPIIQAAHLLQARKKEEDVTSVCEMCSALTPLQICKILNLYTPVDEFEQKVPMSFIRKVQEKLQERSNYQEQQALLMDIKFVYPMRFPFNPSVICLEDIEVPDVLNLPMLEKV